jgi:nitrate/nitrite-specific signal transduction histidine kinase
MEKRLEEMTEEEREELRKFLQRFETELDAKVEVLLYETQDPGSLSDEDRQMRARLLAGYVPLIDDDGERIYRKRAELRILDIARFAAFLDRDAARRKREIGGLGESSKN